MYAVFRITLRTKNTKKLRYTLDDLVSQLRSQGIKNIEEVDYAILENNGELSVFQNTKDYPLPLILDGEIDYDVLKEINNSRERDIHCIGMRCGKFEKNINTEIEVK